MFLESDIVRQPMLPAVRTLVDRIPHRPGINGGRQERIDRERRHAPRAEAWKFLPGPSSIARLVDRIVGGDIEDIGILGMQGNGDNGFALLLAAEKG